MFAKLQRLLFQCSSNKDRNAVRLAAKVNHLVYLLLQNGVSAYTSCGGILDFLARTSVHSKLRQVGRRIAHSKRPWPLHFIWHHHHHHDHMRPKVLTSTAVQAVALCPPSVRSPTRMRARDSGVPRSYVCKQQHHSQGPPRSSTPCYLVSTFLFRQGSARSLHNYNTVYRRQCVPKGQHEP